jgi:hypothetical protein
MQSKRQACVETLPGLIGYRLQEAIQEGMGIRFLPADCLPQVAELQEKLDKLNAEFAQANAEKQEALDSVAKGQCPSFAL